MPTRRDSEDACLFCFSDLPVMEKLALYREEALTENGGHQPVLPPQQQACTAT